MKKAIVLGGTVPHCELINNLKKRGYYVILLDYTEAPPAKEYADKHLKISTLDKEAVLEYAKEVGADLVISTSIDQANVTCCYVAEKLGLPMPYSYQTSLDVTDKAIMKKKMWDNDIPTAKYISIKDKEQLDTVELRYPVMLKPADSNSANGVKIVYSVAEANELFDYSKSFSRNGYVIVEEYLTGKEVSAYFIVKNKEVQLIMMQERLSVFDGVDKVIKCYGSHVPARVSEGAASNSKKVAKQIADAFGLDNTPLFFQGIISGDRVDIIEFAPRTGGGISYKNIMEGAGYDIIDATVRSFLGEELLDYSAEGDGEVYVVNQLYGTDCVYKNTTGAKKLEEEGIINSISFYKHEGDIIDQQRASSSRIGVIVVKGKDDAEVRSKIKKAFSELACYDKDNKDVLRRDLNVDNLWEE